MEREKTTGNLLKVLTGTHTPEELEKYLSEYTQSEEEMNFADCFNRFLDRQGLKKADVIRDSQLDRTYGYQILNGVRQPGRDKIIALCVAAGLSLRETQTCLETAREGILYSKSSRDAVIIYGIEHGINVLRINEMLAERSEHILE